MKKNRDKLSLIAAILEAARNGANKTKIMYNANLSYKLLEKYLKIVMDLDFLQLNSSKYALKEKGLLFLNNYVDFNIRYNEAQGDIAKLEIERELLKQMIEKKRLAPFDKVNEHKKSLIA